MIEQLRELLVHRSIYQLKEADGHTFAIPRVREAERSRRWCGSRATSTARVPGSLLPTR